MTKREIDRGVREARPCEIFYAEHEGGWKWLAREGHGAKPASSEQAFELFYECVTAARAKGYEPDIKCR